MRVVLRPSAAPQEELDLTETLTAAVAYELWRRNGGNEVLNWLEAERFVQSLASPPGPRPEPPTPGRTARQDRRKGARHGAYSPQSPHSARVPEPYTGPLPILGPR
jgi:hypothetical protein